MKAEVVNFASLRLRDVSIRHKLVLISMVTSGVVLLLSCVSFIAYDWISTRDSLVRRAETMADIVGSNCTASLSFDDASDAEETLSGLRAEEHLVAGVLYRAAAGVFATYHRDGIDMEVPVRETRVSRFADDFLVVFRPVVLGGEIIGTIYLKSDLREMDARVQRYAQIVSVFLVAALVIAFLLASRLRYLVTTPIMSLLDTMRQVSEGRSYAIRADKHGEDELGHLIDGFNSMLAQIEDRDAALLRAQDELAVRARQLQVELSERERADAQVRSSLREKEVLLQEIHHRVKNNLQIVSSLLDLQSRGIDDEATADMLLDSRNRVRSMALVHERLYQSENVAEVDLKEYVEDLCANLLRSYSSGTHRVAMQTDVSDITFDIDTAIPCGLIINELVTNALKYAFAGQGGCVGVSLVSSASSYHLRVWNDGAAFPEDVDFRNPSSLGLQLVNILVRQLHGTLELDTSQRTEFAVIFPGVDGNGQP